MSKKTAENDKRLSDSNGVHCSDVVFSAYDSEITISRSNNAKPSHSFAISSPFTSLQSLTRRSISRSASDSQSEEARDEGKRMERSSQEGEVERSNLLNMMKVTVKSLIESSLSFGHTLDSDHKSLQQFFLLMENVLQHRLKGSKRLFGQSKCFWPPLEAVERFYPSAGSITESVRSLPGVKTYLGKGRAWLRLALMQKKLSDYFQVFIENKEFFSEWYDDGALLMSDEASIMLGHLVGLNCIDANLCMKEYDLDNMITLIDYSLLVRDAEPVTNQCEDEESAMQKLLNQKNYLEERNRQLETNLNELQKRVGHLESTNQKQRSDLEVCRGDAESVKRENEKMKKDLMETVQAHEQTLQKYLADMDKERSELIHSKAELDAEVSRIKDQLKQETGMRLDTEKELEHEMSLHHELELALQLQERDLGHKQEGLVALREQLDSVKGVNADLYDKLKTKQCNDEPTTTSAEDTNEELRELREKLEEANRRLGVALEQAGRCSNQLDDSEKARNVLETNLSIEREWRRKLEQEEELRKKETIVLQEKLEMMGTMKEEMRKVEGERDRLLARHNP